MSRFRYFVMVQGRNSNGTSIIVKCLLGVFYITGCHADFGKHWPVTSPLLSGRVLPNVPCASQVHSLIGRNEVKRSKHVTTTPHIPDTVIGFALVGQESHCYEQSEANSKRLNFQRKTTMTENYALSHASDMPTFELQIMDLPQTSKDSRSCVPHLSLLRLSFSFHSLFLHLEILGQESIFWNKTLEIRNLYLFPVLLVSAFSMNTNNDLSSSNNIYSNLQWWYRIVTVSGRKDSEKTCIICSHWFLFFLACK